MAEPNPGAEEVERVRLLTEDADERKSFDRQSAQRGGPLANMAAILTIWSQLNPPQGSMAKLCAIMSNECAKAALPTTQPDRAAIRAESLEEAARLVETIVVSGPEDDEIDHDDYRDMQIAAAIRALIANPSPGEER